MSTQWQNLGPVAWGGSVLSIHTNTVSQTWAATGGGLLARGDTGWRPVPGAPAQPGLVASPGVHWWIAGLNGGLASTWNQGANWWEPWIDRQDAPITCIVPSSRWASDRVMLAGTAGAGVLRSTDGGRRWLLSNFGLQDYTVLALACAPDWSRREIVFAGTTDGVYRSSGGGRAWKLAGLAGLAVQALAVSASFAQNGLALAGAEGAGLYRTRDGGATWQPSGDPLGREASVNALLRVAASDGEAWLAATDLGALWRSTDGGDTWACVYESGDPLLALGGSPDGRLLWAGASELGALASSDFGLAWAPDAALCAWGFRRLLSPDGHALLAWAPTGGVWRSADGGKSWERIAAASHYEPIYAYLPLGAAALEARTEGLWLRREGGPPGSSKDEDPVLDSGDASIVALAADRERRLIWAADVAGNLARSSDRGQTWQPVAVPWSGQQLLTLAASEDDGAPVVATHDATRAIITIWRLADSGWEPWLERPAQWAGAALAPAGKRGEAIWALIAGEVWAHSEDGWEQVALPEEARTVIGLAQRGDVRCLLAGQTLLRRSGGGGWESFPLPEAAAAPVDLLIAGDGAAFCLDAAGTLWRLEA